MDIDPIVFQAPYHHDEVIVDKALNPFFTPYEGLVVSFQENYEKEGTMASQSLNHFQLALYVRRSCPYCKKVVKYLEKERKTILMRDIGKDGKAAQDLVRIGGKRQVPCLVINGKAMYESSDIICWLKDHKHQY